MRSIVPSKVEGSLDYLGMIRYGGSDCFVVRRRQTPRNDSLAEQIIENRYEKAQFKIGPRLAPISRRLRAALAV